MRASLPRWRRVRSSGFFHSANRAPLSSRATAVSPPLRALFQTSRRTWSSASVAHLTTWNGSAQRTAAGQRRATTAAIQGAASALTSSTLAQRGSPRVSKNRSRGGRRAPGGAGLPQGRGDPFQGPRARAGRGPRQPTPVVVDDHGQVPLALL